LTVFDVMLPGIKKFLGVINEQEFEKLDRFLNITSTHHVDVMIEMRHGLELATQPNNPYYHPHGIVGLLTDPRLAQAFKNRITALVNRRNTINQRLYRDDLTILGWMLITEPISAPGNYPAGLPTVTIA
jgi:hypothetical protein